MEEKIRDRAEVDDFFIEFNKFIENQNKEKQIKNDYNVITALLSQSDEVRLHSRFIYSLINPNGKHYKGTLFLKKFLEIIGVKDFNHEEAAVKKEYENIDLYITDGCQHIIVENKIHAYDQNKQICRYISTIKDSSDEETIYDNIQVVYLTLDFKKPSTSSLDEWLISNEWLQHNLNTNNKVRYKNITYKIDIINWINNCIKDGSELPNNISSAIESYKEVVEKLTHIKGSNVMMINEYLLEPENFDKLLVTASLVNSFKSIRGKLLRQFFTGLDKAVDCKKFADKYTAEEIKQFSYDCKDDSCDNWFVGRRQNAHYHVGTFYKIYNKPIVIGLMVAEQKLYFVIRIIGDDKMVEMLLKDGTILNDKYKCWGIIKNKKEVKLNLHWMSFNNFHDASVDYNIYRKINQKSILTLLCKKESVEKIADKMAFFANSLNGIKFPEE